MPNSGLATRPFETYNDLGEVSQGDVAAPHRRRVPDLQFMNPKVVIIALVVALIAGVPIRADDNKSSGSSQSGNPEAAKKAAEKAAEDAKKAAEKAAEEAKKAAEKAAEDAKKAAEKSDDGRSSNSGNSSQSGSGSSGSGSSSSALDIESNGRGNDDNVAGDQRARDFLNNTMPALSQLLRGSLASGRSLSGNGVQVLDPTRLRLTTETDARMYFIGGSEDLRNNLGSQDREARVLFGGVSNDKVDPGAYADLGRLPAGSDLDFFLITKRSGSERSALATSASSNPDAITHGATFAAMHGTMLILGFDQIYGEDDDEFNRLLFAIDLGSVNVAALTGTPEPRTWLVLGTLVGGVAWLKRRQARSRV